MTTEQTKALRALAEAATPGPWVPALHQGYSTTYWTIKRKNHRFLGGIETMLNASFNPRRLKSESAARIAIAEAKEQT